MENYIAFENVERKFGVLACIAAAIYLPYLSYAWILTTLDSTTMAIVKLSSSSLSSYSIASINLSVRQCLFIVYCCCRCYYHFVLHFTASHRYRHPEKRILTEKILRHDCSRIMNEKLWLLLLALCERSDIRFIVRTIETSNRRCLLHCDATWNENHLKLSVQTESSSPKTRNGIDQKIK